MWPLSFLLVINSYIPNWGLQKNADGHISSLGDLRYERELNISVDKVVLSCKNVCAYSQYIDAEMCHYIFTRLYFQNYVDSFIISPEVLFSAPR